MKKSLFIMISLAIAFFFAGTLEVTAQWSVDITIVDNNCNCGTITGKTIEWEIKDLVTNLTISSGQKALSNSNPYTLEGDEGIIYDAQDRYYFVARITYYAPTQCCTGWNSDTFDGDQLVDDNSASLTITMN